MTHRLTLKPLLNRRGMTLVELMIVVAIIGILASLAGVAFLRQIKNAKITQLDQYAMDLSRGQNEFYSHHGSYYPVQNSLTPTFTGADDPNAPGTRQVVKQVMGFNAPTLPEEATIRISAGRAGDTCDTSVCIEGVTVDTTTAWYAILIEQDLSPGDMNNSTVVVTSDMEKPMRFYEGQ